MIRNLRRMINFWYFISVSIEAYLYLWAITVFMIQLASPPFLLIISDAGFSSCRILIVQAPALVDFRRLSQNN